MRIIGVHHLKPGMKLGKPIYSAANNGIPLITADVAINEAAIFRLKELEIPWVYIEDDLSADVKIENVINEETKVRVIQNIKAILTDIKPKKLDRQNKSLIPIESYKKISDCVSEIMDNINNNRRALFNLVNIMGSDMSLYSHLVNVAVLSILVALEMELPMSKVYEIGMGALLHDIGKTELESSIAAKSEEQLKPKELERFKMHPAIGYSMLKEDKGISAIVKTILLMHHENIDGSGYPVGLNGDQINIYARIVAASNILDNLIAVRVGKPEMPMYKALEVLSSKCITKIDSEVYKCLIKKIAPFPPGTGVILNTGEKALVTVNNPNMPSRPIIKVIKDSSGNLCARLIVIDMAKNLTIFIDGTCDI